MLDVRVSFVYAIPSVMYAFNNNVYFYALHYVTPPVWNMLGQIRIIITALTYWAVFRRVVTGLQWLALVMIVGMIVCTNRFSSSGGVGEGDNTGRMQSNVMVALGLAAVGSVASVIGTITIEVCISIYSGTI